MLNSVKKFIKENNLENKTILLGLSGGADSSVLFDILSKIKNINLIAIHFNHNWRGIESDNDEKFAYNLAKSKNIPFYSEKTDNNDKKTETMARELRYAFFEKCREKFRADAVFLAHNKNDNIETLIYRLIKGTGPRGLKSILKIRDCFYRPLLDFTRDEIIDYAKENNVQYITDNSNFDTKYKRNLIREEIIPLMKEINPEVINSISSFIKVNIMQQNLLDKIILETKKEIFEGDKILRDKFLSLDKELKFEIINSIMQGVLKNRDYKNIEKTVNFIEENDSKILSLNGVLFLKVYDNKIYMINSKIEKCDREVILKEGINHFLNYKFIIEKASVPNVFPDAKDDIQYLNLDFQNRYTIRTKKEGDKIQPFNSKTTQKLKTYFIKKKIPSELRNKIPLICLNDEVIFIPYFTVSEKNRVEKNQKNCYSLKIIKE